MPIMPRLSKAQESSSASPSLSKSERAIKANVEIQRYLAALTKLESALDETEKASRGEHIEGRPCWLDEVFK